MKNTLKTSLCLLLTVIMASVFSLSCFASYSTQTHSVEIISGEGGSTYSYTGKYEFARNEWVLIVCNPDDINNEVDTFRVYEKETGREINAKYTVSKDSYFANVGFYMGDYDVIVEITYKFSDNPFYSITVDSNKDDPDVKLNRTMAREGDRITVEPESYEGIRAKEVTYMCGDEIYPTKPSTSGIYSFNMPAGDAVVYVDYYPTEIDSHEVRILTDDYGFLEIDENRYIPGETVTVRTHADTERCVTDLEYYSQQKGYDVRDTATDMGDGTFTFIMPDYDVFLFASYGKPDSDTVIDIETRYDIMEDINSEYGNIVCIHDRAYADEDIEFAINVKEGCYLDSVRVIASKSGDIIPCNYDKSRRRYSFVMPASSVTISAAIYDREQMEKYDILLDYNKNCGSVTVPTGGMAEGDKIIITVEPKKGYRFSDVGVRNISSDKAVQTTMNNGVLYFYMPGSDVEVTVYFEENGDSVADDNEAAEVKKYRIQNSTDPQYATVTKTLSKAEQGERVYFTVQQKPGYIITSVKVFHLYTDKTVFLDFDSDSSMYSFIMPADNVQIKVKTSVDLFYTREESEKPAEHICPAMPYTDIDSSMWYHDAVDYVIWAGLMGGYSESTFAPQETTTRAMITTVLWRLDGCPAASSANPFKDVASDIWYADAVAWAAETGIVNGVGARMFDPDGKVTREQLAAMVYRYAAYKGGLGEVSPLPLDYPDLSNISVWAVDAMTWCNNNAIIFIRDGKLMPAAPAERVEIAFAMYNLANAR